MYIENNIYWYICNAAEAKSIGVGMVGWVSYTVTANIPTKAKVLGSSTVTLLHISAPLLTLHNVM